MREADTVFCASVYVAGESASSPARGIPVLICVERSGAPIVARHHKPTPQE
jgi:hypothetical protein